MIIPVHDTIDFITWHSDPASIYSKCWVNLTVRCTNISTLIIIIIIIMCSALRQVLHCKRRNLGCSSDEGRSSTANSGTKAAVLLRFNWRGSFPLLSAPHSLFSTWTDLKRSEKIPGAPTRRWGEWIWLTGPSRLHWNSPQGLNISCIGVFDQIRDPEIPINLRYQP